MPFLTLTRFALVVALCAAFSPQGAHAQGNEPPAVIVAKPLKDEVTDWDEYTGRFQARQSVTLQARVSGYLQETHFNDGQIVEAGDLLFTIDPRPFELAKAQAEAQVQSAEAGLQLAEVEFNRATELVERNVGRVSDQDQARAQYQQALANLALAEADLAIAELDLGYTRVRAPITGRISSADVDMGALVIGGPSGATELSNIVSIHPIEFVFTASEAEFLKYARLNDSGERPSSRTNANPIFVQLLDEDTWDRGGKMDFVDNRLDPNSGTILGRAQFDNQNGFLQPGVFGRARLLASAPYEALMIPDEAIVADQSRSTVYVVGPNNVVEQRVVTRGAIWRGFRVIRAGLEADDRVVISGVQRVRPGAPATPEEQPLSFEGEG